VNDEESAFIFCGCFYGDLDLLDQFEEYLLVTCSTFYHNCHVVWDSDWSGLGLDSV